MRREKRMNSSMLSVTERRERTVRFAAPAHVVIFDLEFTAWEGSMESRWMRPGELTEIVQIGAVKLDAASLKEVDAFEMLVKPRVNPVLSDYLVSLTGIGNRQLAHYLPGRGIIRLQYSLTLLRQYIGGRGTGFLFNSHQNTSLHRHRCLYGRGEKTTRSSASWMNAALSLTLNVLAFPMVQQK